MTGGVVGELERIDPRVVIDEPQYLEALFAQTLAQRQETLTLLLVAAGVVVLLTGFSVTGTLSQFVEYRTREIALRKALGSSHRRTIGLVLGYVVRPAGIGLLLGCLGGWLVAQRLSAQLFAVDAGDPAAFVEMLVAQLSFGAIAAAGPVRRAVRIEPVSILRGL